MGIETDPLFGIDQAVTDEVRAKLGFFISQGMVWGIHLLGPEGPSDIAINGFLALFPFGDSGEKVFAEAVPFGIDSGNHPLSDFLSLVLSLQLPEKRTEEARLIDDLEINQAYREVLQHQGLPFALLAFGEEPNGESMIALYSHLGVSPKTALEEIQTVAKRMLGSLVCLN